MSWRCFAVSDEARDGGRGRRRMLRRKLERFERRAASTELLRFLPRVLKLRPGVGIDEKARLDSLEPVARHQLRVRSFQERTCDSAGPEIDVAPAHPARAGSMNLGVLTERVNIF